MPACPFLAHCVSAFKSARRDLENLASAVSDRQAAWHPAPRRWSIAECIEHLNVTHRGYSPRLERALDKGRRRGWSGSSPYPQSSFLGRMILRVLDPEAGRTFPAPRVFRPAAGELDFASVCGELRRGLDHFAELAERADGLDLGRIRFATPVAPWPRLTLAEAFEIHSLHIPRHLAQAEAVRNMPGFPASSRA